MCRQAARLLWRPWQPPLAPTPARTCPRVAHQQHVHLAADVAAALLLPRHAAAQHQQAGQLHGEEAMQLRADRGHQLVAALQGAGGVGGPELAERSLRLWRHLHLALALVGPHHVCCLRRKLQLAAHPRQHGPKPPHHHPSHLKLICQPEEWGGSSSPIGCVAA